jgi:hypothetical protein
MYPEYRKKLAAMMASEKPKSDAAKDGGKK